jgi:hypothetical protein
LPYAVYPKSNFWTDSPELIAMRTGIALVLLAGCYTWTTYAAGAGWSWMQCLGRHSLLVYWVHLMLVYGPLTAGLQKALSISAASGGRGRNERADGGAGGGVGVGSAAKGADGILGIGPIGESLHFRDRRLDPLPIHFLFVDDYRALP